MEGEYLDAIQQAGLMDVELVSIADVFAGAEGGQTPAPLRL